MTDRYFDYFTAAEAEQFSFYRMPKALFTEKDFEGLSCEAKVLYGMMLDRMGLSIRNQWFDSQGRAYIIFTVEDVMSVMGCRSQKAVRLMKELDTADGVGLIEKKRIGLGRPNRIYVKNFMSYGNENPQKEDYGACEKEKVMPCDTDTMQKEEAVHADMSESRKLPACEDNGCMEHVAETGNTADCRNKNGQMTGKIWLKYADISEKEADNQNSDGSAKLSKEADEAGKEYGFADEYFSMKCVAEIPEMAEICPAAGESENAKKNKRVFADKEVEDMVKELLWQEEKTCGSAEPDLRKDSRQEFPETKELHMEKHHSAAVDNEIPELRNAKRNDTEYSNTENSETEYSKTEKNETDFSITDPSYPSIQSDPSGRYHGQDADTDKDRKADGMEEKMDAYREIIRQNISYASFQFPELENVDELVELMTDAMMVPDRHTIRIAGTEKPASVVKSRFMKLMYPHIRYILECLNKHTGKIRNIRAYLLTALYNSTLTISNYYRAEVNHDLYGCGC